MKIRIKSQIDIGDACPPFIIAEVGSNWQTLQDCIDSIVKAKHAGADAVKFQAFTGAALYGNQADINYQLPIEWLPKLKEKADACGIEFMCTAFSPELYDAVDPYVSIHKVASAEATHLRILEKVNTLGKPVILSTGAKGETDIINSLLQLQDVPTILMYCVAAYPATEVNLKLIPMLKTLCPLVGYSDHSTDVIVIPDAAVNHGACVIEKHFTAITANTPDKGHSLDPDQFAHMVKRLKSKPLSTIGPTKEEKPMVLRHNRRLIATMDLKAGDVLQEGMNFGIYRSLKDDTRAMHPFAVNHAQGKQVKGFIAAGDGIAPSDIE